MFESEEKEREMGKNVKDDGLPIAYTTLNEANLIRGDDRQNSL